MICVESYLVDILAVVLYVLFYFYDFVVVKGKIILEPYVQFIFYFRCLYRPACDWVVFEMTTFWIKLHQTVNKVLVLH